MSDPDRVPWPFPGPYYDWNEADEAAAQMALLTRELWPDLVIEDVERTPPPM